MNFKDKNDRIVTFLKSIKFETISYRSFYKSERIINWWPSKHSHDFVEFIYFIDAGADVRLTGDSLHLFPFDIIMYPPGVEHQEFTNSYYEQKIICFSFNADCVKSLDMPIVMPDKNGIIRGLFEQVCQEDKNRRIGCLEIIDTYIKLIILYITSYFEEDISNAGIDAVSFCIQYIRDNFNDNITLEKLSEVAHISKAYLTKLFNQKTNMTPMHYVNFIRIEVAKGMLLTSNMPIKEISFAVGYSDPLYFSRLFKKKTGLTPCEYRKK